MKHVGGEQSEPIKNLSEILDSIPSSIIDAAETDNFVQLKDDLNNVTQEDDDKGPAFPDPPERPDTMSLHPKEFYEKQAGFSPRYICQ